MISKYAYKKLTWIDLESPTKEEVLSLMQEYAIPELVGEELITPTLRSKVDVYGNLIYLILHFPIHPKNRKKNGGAEQEIDFVIGQNFIITTHYERIDPLHEFSKMFNVNSVLDRSMMGEHAGFLFYYIIRELYKYSLTQLEEVNESLRDIEKNIFEGREGEMVETISNVNRTLLDFKQAIRFHAETLKSFETAGGQFFGTQFSYYLGAMTGEYNKIQNMLDGHKEILNDLRNTNDSLLSSKTNDTMKKLTIMNFIILPLALLTGVFGMNMNFVFIKTTTDFTVVVGAMLLIAVLMFLYFKEKRWF